VIHRYGEHPDQFCEQAGSGGPTVVLLHGGFWRARYGLDLMRPMADDLVQRGWVTWNVEYRRVGTGGGYPATLEDVAAACRAADRLGLGPLVSLGHSAGGHLSLWLAGEGLVAGAVSLGGVCCLAGASEERLGNSAADDFMGASSDDARDAYGRADPLRRLPTGVPTTLVHGVNDDTVPIEQSRTYAAAARAAGDDCALVELPGDHFDVIDPRSAAWPAVVSGLERVRSSFNPA
jgi:acetyl esterase/lipase